MVRLGTNLLENLHLVKIGVTCPAKGLKLALNKLVKIL